MNTKASITLTHPIHAYRQFALEQLPVLEKEVNDLVERKETRQEVIGCLLELVYSLTELGVGQELLKRLQGYYETIDQK